MEPQKCTFWGNALYARTEMEKAYIIALAQLQFRKIGTKNMCKNCSKLYKNYKNYTQKSKNRVEKKHIYIGTTVKN